MKNRIKGAFVVLLMLFGCLCFSEQAYANGSPPKTIQVFENEELVKKLALNDNFVVLNFNSALMYFLINVNMDKFSSEQKAKNFDRLNSLANNDKSFSNDAIAEVTEIVGFDDTKSFSFLNTKIQTQLKTLKIDFPELDNLNQTEKNDIYVAVFAEKNYQNKYATQVALFGSLLPCLKAGLVAFSSSLLIPISVKLIAEFLVAVSICTIVALAAATAIPYLVAYFAPWAIEGCFTSSLELVTANYSRQLVIIALAAGIGEAIYCYNTK